MSKGLVALFSAAVFAFSLFSGISPDAAEQYGVRDNRTEDKVVMVIADYLDVYDIGHMDFLSKLAGESYMALLNNRQLGKAGADGSKLIIGSGKRLELGSNMAAGGSDESSRRIYSIEGGRAPKPGSLVYADMYKLMKRNKDSEYLKYIGYMGETVKKNKGVTCLIGNSDTAVKNRSSILITMDKNGEVDLGDTENTTIEDELFPYGIRTNYNKLAELYKQYLSASSFIVVETGDMERLESFRSSMSETSYNAYKRGVINEIDGFIERLISYGGFNTLVFISTYPSAYEAAAGNRLTPIIVFDASGAGVLYSKSTRREGIILNTDLADYMLCKLGYLESSAIEEHKREEAGLFLKTMNRNIMSTSNLRLPVLSSYAAIIIAVIIMLFAIVVFSRKKLFNRYSLLSNLAVYTMLVFPLVLLYIPTAYFEDRPAAYTMLLAVVALVFSLVLHIAIKDRVKAIFIICMLLLLGLSADVFTGSRFIKQSVLGYDPIIGARFYGIGNEYAGMYIGCSLVTWGCLQEAFRIRPGKIASAAYYFVCTSILGFTMFGANFGGAVAAASGYVLAYFLVYDIKFNKRNALIGILMLCALPILLVGMDFFGSSSPSHLGTLVKETEANGFGVIASTIQRKISMNLRLIRYTIWTKVLICIIAAISVMLFKPARLLRSVFGKYKHLKHSWIGIAASAIIGLAVNDSGIVLAATAMIYVAFTMLHICIGERDEG